MTDLRSYRFVLEDNKKQLKACFTEMGILQGKIDKQTALIADLREAREVLSTTGILAQQQTKGVIEQLVTEALHTVCGPEYSFEIVDEIARNKAESFLYIVKDGHRQEMKDELGGTTIDVVSFVLRTVMWALQVKKTAHTFILDEPGKYISKDRLPMFGNLIRHLSEMLGLQFIIVSHEEELIEFADKAFKVTQKKGISSVEVVKDES